MIVFRIDKPCSDSSQSLILHTYHFQVTAQDMAQASMSANPITSHVLNTATGQPAANMKISLHKCQEGAWQEVATK